MLSLVSPPSEMSNLGVVLGTPDTDPKYINILRGPKRLFLIRSSPASFSSDKVLRFEVRQMWLKSWYGQSSV